MTKGHVTLQPALERAAGCAVNRVFRAPRASGARLQWLGARVAGGTVPIAPVCAGGWGGHSRARGVVSQGASMQRKHVAEPPNLSGSFGNGTSCVWLFGHFPPLSVSEATGSGGTSPPRSPALTDFGVRCDAGTHSADSNTMAAFIHRCLVQTQPPAQGVRDPHGWREEKAVPGW